MNQDTSREVSSTLKLSFHVIQECTFKQIQSLSALISNPIPLLAHIGKTGLIRLRDLLRKEDIVGSVGKELNFSRLDSIMKQLKISINEDLSQDQKNLLFAGLCRYPETKTINSQIFVHLLSYWVENFEENVVDKLDEINDRVSKTWLHMKAAYPEICYIFDILNERLIRSNIDKSLLRGKLSKSDFIDLLRRVELRLSSADTVKLFDILSKIKAYNRSTDDIDMKIFIRFLEYNTNSANKIQIVDSEQIQIYSTIVNMIRRHAIAIRAKIVAYNKIYGLDENNVSIQTFQRAVQDSGIAVLDNDVKGLWDYLFDSVSSDQNSISLEDFDSKLLKVNENNNRTSLANISEEAAYTKIRKGSIQDIKPPPFAISNTSRPASADISTSSALTRRSSRAIDTFSMNGMKSQIENEKLPIWQPTPQLYRSNICTRICLRVHALSDTEKQDLVREILKIDDKKFIRSDVSRVLSKFNVKILHADCDGIWSELCDITKNPKPTDFLMYLRIGDDAIQMALTSLKNEQSRSEIDGNCGDVVKYSSDTVLQDSTKYDQSNINIGDVHSTINSMKEKSVKNSQATAADADLCESNAENKFDSNSIAEVGKQQNLTVINDENISSIRKIPRMKRPGHDSSLMAQHLSDEIVDVNQESSIEPFDNIQSKFSSAVERLQKNRVNLASIFRKLLGTEGRLSENSVSCRRLAEAILQPPISLQLTKEDSYRLICEMTNPNFDYDTAISSTPQIYFHDILVYLDHQPDAESTNSSSQSNDVGTYRTGFIRNNIKMKLQMSGDVRGDRLKLLSLIPKLRSRYRSKISAGRNVSSWESNISELCSMLMLKELLHSIDVKIDTEESRYIIDQVNQKHKHDIVYQGIGDSSVRLGDACLFISEVLR